jgi:2-methylcitrate dehydratase
MDKATTQIAEYAASLRFEDLTPEAVHECKRRLIDTLGCAFGAYDAEPSRVARAVAARYTGNPPARVIGTLQPSSPEHAAFANGTMLRYTDFNDSYFNKSSGHPSDMLAAVLAVGDSVHADGKIVVTASAIAYEAFCNLSDVLPRESGWDYVIHGVLGAALASGKLLGLDAKQMGHAVSLALTPNMALEQTRLGELSHWKGCAAANASRNGVFAALLAQQGLTGPADPIEGRYGMQKKAVGAFQWAPFGGKGGPFRITRTHLKYYPAVVHSQSPIAAAIDLHRQKVDPRDVKAIDIQSYWIAGRYTDRSSHLWNPGTRETADHSIAFNVASAIVDGTLSAESFREERLRDPLIRGLLEKMTIRENPEFTRAHPESWLCRIEVTTGSGARKVATSEFWKGHVRNPMSDEEVEAKFRRLSVGLLGPDGVSRVLAKLWALDRLGNIGELIDLLAVKK